MVGLSALEKRRQANIKNNAELLKQLELEGMAQGIAPSKAPAKSKPAKKRSTDPAPSSRRKSQRIAEIESMPRRKSRRLEGLESQFSLQEQDYAVEQQLKKEKEDRDRDRVEGEKKLKDVIQRGDWDSATSILSTLGDKVSQGDYFDLLSETPKGGDKNIAKAREEFGNLQMDTRFDATGVKLVTERIFTMFVHPDPGKKLVMAGDKMGELGVWDADGSKEDENGDEDPITYSFKVHSRAIAKILPAPKSPEKIYMASYDGSIRCLDFKTEECVESYIFDSNPREPIGVSDLCIPDPNSLYFSTLDGHIGLHDVRTKQTEAIVFRAHDKKIGGFSVNPHAPHQIATASLDRTMKLWDIRNPKRNDETEEDEPHLYASFDSRLSVSCVDWNRSGQLVCNGYADLVHVFDLDSNKWKQDFETVLKPDVSFKHNCQTGRWVSILKARWQMAPQDIVKFAIGNMNRYIDVYASDGQQLAHLGGDGMTAVPACVCLHPTQNWAVGGSASGKVYLWS